MRIGLAVFVLGVAGFVSTIGTPHILSTYDCRPASGGGCAFYWECDYLGVDGTRRYFPGIEPDHAEDCPAFKFFTFAGPAAPH